MSPSPGPTNDLPSGGSRSLPEANRHSGVQPRDGSSVMLPTAQAEGQPSTAELLEMAFLRAAAARRARMPDQVIAGYVNPNQFTFEVQGKRPRDPSPGPPARRKRRTNNQRTTDVDEAVVAEVNNLYPTPDTESREERRRRLQRRRTALARRRKKARDSSAIRETDLGASVSRAASVETPDDALRPMELDGTFDSAWQINLPTERASNGEPQARTSPQVALPVSESAPSVGPDRSDEPERGDNRVGNPGTTIGTNSVGDARPRRGSGDGEQRSRRRSNQGLLHVALGSHEAYTHPQRQILGSRVTCQHCAAERWESETDSICCNGGQVRLPLFEEPPQELRLLFDNRAFMQNIRKYNNAFAFTSMGASTIPSHRVRQDELVARGGVYNYRVQGALCHRIGGLQAAPGQRPMFAQLYFYDSSEEGALQRRDELRSSFVGNLDPIIVESIERVLQEHNPHAQTFRHAFQRMSTGESVRVSILSRAEGVDQRRYNRPTASEVAGILLNAETGNTRDLYVQETQSGRLTKVFETSQSYDALQYPLLHPYGELGWAIGIPKQARQPSRERVRRQEDDDDPDNDANAIREPGGGEASSKRVTTREYAAFRLSTRPGQHELFHRAGRLFQQYCVDQYIKLETQRLKYQRDNQSQLRAEAYSGIMDLAGGEQSVIDLQPQLDGVAGDVSSDHRLPRTGTNIILAPSFVGGERYMRTQYQDAMAIVRTFGKPDLFVTVTCNPKWPEITENLLPGQTASDRPDLTARVFRLKLQSILEDISKGALGVQVARILVIEFQKRGLPHAHILIILRDEDKPRSPADYDKFVSAEIPDPENTELYETVVSCMMHGPCGAHAPTAPCMKDGKCSKRYPREFVEETRRAENGYPIYRRRNNGRTVMVRNAALSNQHVVPYNPWLTHKYNCHINVEVCTTVTSVKYLYKYVYKGHDRIAVTVGQDQTRDEIQQFLDGRYISASESCWRIFRFPIQQKSHSVISLPIHLENQQSVVFQPDATVASVLNRGRHTMLTRFFDLCREDTFARTLTYQEVPVHYRYAYPTNRSRRVDDVDEGDTAKRWLRRVRNINTPVGRMVSCSMKLMERYCLRLLLCYRRGPTSFEDLRTVNGEVCPTFKEAAIREGLLQDDSEWDRALQEAISFQMPAQLRQLFAMVLAEGFLQAPRLLWDRYRDAFCEDYHRQNRDRYTIEQSDQNQRLRDMEAYQALRDIDQYLCGIGKELTLYDTMPQLADFTHIHNDLMVPTNPLIDAERSYDVNVLDNTLATLDQLNEDQRMVYDEVVNAVDSPSAQDGNLFFLDGPGGTGKSFVVEKILAYVRRQSKIALAVASSGISALLLSGGKTVHSTFKVPLNLTETSSCAIPVQSKLADLIREASLIVWDEASMSSRYALEAVDRAMKDITNDSQLFGGKVVMLCGDFRQILPVVPKGTDAQIIQQCIKMSPLWPHFKKLRLTVNMRVRTTPNLSEAGEIQEFADYLLKIGEGRHDTAPGRHPCAYARHRI